MRVDKQTERVHTWSVLFEQVGGKFGDSLPPAVMECFLTSIIDWLIPPGDLDEIMGSVLNL